MEAHCLDCQESGGWVGLPSLLVLFPRKVPGVTCEPFSRDRVSLALSALLNLHRPWTKGTVRLSVGQLHSKSKKQPAFVRDPAQHHWHYIEPWPCGHSLWTLKQFYFAMNFFSVWEQGSKVSSSFSGITHWFRHGKDITYCIVPFWSCRLT